MWVRGLGVREWVKSSQIQSPARCVLALPTAYFQQLTTSHTYHRLTPCCVVVVVVGIVEVNRRHGKVGRKRASPRSRK